MEQVVVVGVDSVAGRAIASQLGTGSTIKEFRSTDISSTLLKSALADADLLVFCGGASRSSWDAGFGDLTPEEEWLSIVLDACTPECQIVFVSSDIVFDGPWVFHDDESSAVSADEPASSIRQFESQVAARRNSLVIRTNVLGFAGQTGFAGRVVDRLETGECEHVPGRSYATPIAASEFAELVGQLLNCHATGFINVAGAERTSPWRLGTALASALGHSSDALLPEESSPVVEHSLRCQRLRQEFDLTVPVLRQTIDRLVDELQAQQQAAHPTREFAPAAA